jgi:DNA-binding NarL/FixJ family response regulator
VLVADDDDDFRGALARVLDAVEGIEVVGVARDGLEAMRVYRSVNPDIVLMDFVMPRSDGLDATKQIMRVDPGARIIVMSGTDDLRGVWLCLAAGARGCLSKDLESLKLAPLMVLLAGRPGGASERSRPAPAKPPTRRTKGA